MGHFGGCGGSSTVSPVDPDVDIVPKDTPINMEDIVVSSSNEDHSPEPTPMSSGNDATIRLGDMIDPTGLNFTDMAANRTLGNSSSGIGSLFEIIGGADMCYHVIPVCNPLIIRSLFKVYSL